MCVRIYVFVFICKILINIQAETFFSHIFPPEAELETNFFKIKDMCSAGQLV